MKNATFLHVVFALGVCYGEVAAADLRAGVGRADLTPPIGGPMYGYGARGSDVSQGVHDPLYAKALVLDDGATTLAIVTLDLGSFTQENSDNVRRLVSEKRKSVV